MRRWLPLACVCLGAGSLVWSPGTVRAAPEGAAVSVEAKSCEQLDADAVARILELELSELAERLGELQAPPVTLRCTTQRVRIAVDDPVTGKKLSRTVARPASSGGERALALAISQLFLTSWLELLLPPEEQATPAAKRPSAAVDAATERARRAVRPEPDAEHPGPERRWGLRLAGMGGLRVRDLGRAWVGGYGGLQAGVELREGLQAFVQASFEQGGASRERGAITTRIADFGIGAGWRSALSGPWSLHVRAAVSALYVHMEGRPSRSDVRGQGTSQAAAQVLLQGGPAARLGDIRLGLSAELGMTGFAPEGTVSDEPSVSPSGLFGGASLSVEVLP